MTEISVEISIKNLAPEVQVALENAIKRGLFAIGENAVKNAQHYVDVEKRIDTGRMRRSINHNEGATETIIGTNVEYAYYQELGTSRGIQPALFLTRSARNHSKEYVKIMKESIKNA